MASCYVAKSCVGFMQSVSTSMMLIIDCDVAPGNCAAAAAAAAQRSDLAEVQRRGVRERVCGVQRGGAAPHVPSAVGGSGEEQRAEHRVAARSRVGRGGGGATSTRNRRRRGGRRDIEVGAAEGGRAGGHPRLRGS